MLPTRWDPFRELGTLRREIDDLFRRTFGGPVAPAAERGAYFTPAINTYVKGNTYFIEAELPGMKKEDLDLSVEGNQLTLRGERKYSKETKEEDYMIQESQYGSFLRQLTLPEGVNTEKVHASYEDGILRIDMPMEKKLAGGRKVMIEGSESGKKRKEVH